MSLKRDRMSLHSWIQVWIVVLYSLPVATGQPQLNCSRAVVACAGDDVIIPCRLDPPTSTTSRAIEWTKPGLYPEYVHVHQDGRLVYQSQNPLFNYRTTLFVDQLINGNVSLKLLRVKTSDSGRYKCFIPSLWREAFVQVTVREEGDVCKEDSGKLQTSCSPWIAISSLLTVLIIIAAACLGLTWRKMVNERKKHNDKSDDCKGEGSQKLLERSKLTEELQRNQEELKDQEQFLKTLNGLKEELETQKDHLTVKVQEAKVVMQTHEEKTKNVEEEIKEKEGDKSSHEAEGFLKLKNICREAGSNHENTIKELQQLHTATDKILRRTTDDINKMTKKKQKAEEDIEKIKKKMEGTENQSGE